MDSSQSVTLKPSPRLPLLIGALGLVLALLPIPFNPWPGIVVIIFSLFLLIQAYTLRLEFTKDSLVVLQLGKELRRFPYKYWLAWRIFLPKLPGILYFREEVSPHLLPIIFDPVNLENQLRLRVGHLERPEKSEPES